jgi:serine/threonine protein kinase
VIGQTISHYRITAKLGEGGMGAVYRATDEKLQREVALKFLPADLAADAEARKRLVKEARAASRLNHPNIGTIYEVNDEGSAPFIAMELVKGESLKQRLQRGTLSPADLFGIARQIAEGLNEAHHAGVLHRDIKPANVMLDDHGRVKILDFGIATLTGLQRGQGETEENFVSRTATQAQATTGGTIPYMAPELCAAKTPMPAATSFLSASCFTNASPAACPSAATPPLTRFTPSFTTPPRRCAASPATLRPSGSSSSSAASTSPPPAASSP